MNLLIPCCLLLFLLFLSLSQEDLIKDRNKHQREMNRKNSAMRQKDEEVWFEIFSRSAQINGLLFP